MHDEYLQFVSARYETVPPTKKLNYESSTIRKPRLTQRSIKSC
jgi:hypothetical protein